MCWEHQHQPQDEGRGHGPVLQLHGARGQPPDQLRAPRLPEGKQCQLIN